MLLISIDTLRADRLPAYGFHGVDTPALDALRADGILVERAYSHYPLTFPSHVSILSGQLPPNHGVRDNLGYRFEVAKHPCFPRALADRGYATAGFVSAFVLRRETGLGECFQTYDSAIELGEGADLGSAQRPGPETARLALAWLRALRSRKFFLFLHLYEPHAPYDPPEPFRSKYAEHYLGEIATADAIVGDVVAELRRQGLYDQTLILVVSDHGEGLGDHGEAQHGVFLYQEATRVPWILKLPGEERRGTSLPGPAGLVDVAPTLLALTGVGPPAGLDGQSVFAAPESFVDRRIYSETWYPRLHFGWSELRALTDRRMSFIDAPEPELYDLEADRGESLNVAAGDRRAVAERRAEVRRIDRPLVPPNAASGEEAAKLAALGYLSGMVETAGRDLPDPKSQKPMLLKLQLGLARAQKADDAEAARLFRELLVDNPAMTDVWVFLARSEQRRGNLAGAIEAWKEAYARNHEPAHALNIALLLLREGDFDGARRHAELGLERDPKRAYDILVQIALRRGDRAEVDRLVAKASSGGAVSEGVSLLKARDVADAGRPGEAVTLLEPFADTGDASTLAVLGLALADSGRIDEGAALLARAREKEADNPEVLENLGVTELRREHTDAALEALERAVVAAPKVATAWNSLGVARYRAGHTREALAAWDRAASLDPQLLDALFNQGLVAAEIGDLRAARRALGRFLERAPAERYGPDRERARQVLRHLGVGG
ncbi:MAG: sulfatase-like hydrolase/transferase [Thermoanaerobaculia bacterium]